MPKEKEETKEPVPTKASTKESIKSRESLTFWETLSSVLWAMLGVQKEKNAKRDFSKGKASHFILIGLLFALVFVLTLYFIVSFVTRHAN